MYQCTMLSNFLCFLQHLQDTNQYVKGEMDALEHEQGQIDDRAAELESELRKVMGKSRS